MEKEKKSLEEFKKEFDPAEYHLNNKKILKSDDIDQVLENYQKDPAPRVGQLFTNYLSKNGMEMSIAYGKRSDHYYSSEGMEKINEDIILSSNSPVNWRSTQLLYIKLKDKKKNELPKAGDEITFIHKRKQRVFIKGIVKGIQIERKRVTGQLYLDNVVTGKIPKK